MAVLKPDAQVGVREGLSDVLTYVSPTDTPLYSKFPKKRIATIYHEWQTQALPSAGVNAQPDGFSWSAGTVTARVRTGNYVQTLAKCYSISRTSMKIAVAGIKDEYAEQKKLAMLQLVNEVEYALLNGTGNNGAGGTRELKGVRAFITTNNITGTGTGNEALTESMLNDALQAVREQGGNPTDIYCNATKKRIISGFPGRSSSAINIDATSKTVVNTVDTYISDFGVSRIHYHRLMPNSEVLVLDESTWAIAILDEFGPEEVLTGNIHGISFGMSISLTLEAKAEMHNGKITQLS